MMPMPTSAQIGEVSTVNRMSALVAGRVVSAALALNVMT